MDKQPKKPGEQLKANRQAIVFFTCVLLATFIWFINALSKQYSTTIEQPVIYKGLPASVLPTQLPQKISMEVSGRGFDLMQYFFNNDNHSLIIDLQKLPSSVFAGNPNSVNTIRLLSESGNIADAININSVTPEIIQLNSMARFNKKVPVKADAKYDFKKQYAQSGPFIIQPDSVYVSGDSLTIKKIKEVTTEPAEFNNLDHTLFHSIKLMQPDSSKISYSSNKVWLYLKVEPFTEGSVTIPVTVMNSGMKQITLVPDIVTVSYHVPLSLYNNIRPEQFEVTTSIPKNIEANKLKIKIARKPLEVTNVTVVPEEVDFFIKQK